MRTPEPKEQIPSGDGCRSDREGQMETPCQRGSNLNRSGGWDRGERGSGKRPAESNADTRPWVMAPRRRGPGAGEKCRSEVPTALLLLGVWECACVRVCVEKCACESCVGRWPGHSFWLPSPSSVTCSGATGFNSSEGPPLPLGWVQPGGTGPGGHFRDVRHPPSRPPCHGGGHSLDMWLRMRLLSSA